MNSASCTQYLADLTQVSPIEWSFDVDIMQLEHSDKIDSPVFEFQSRDCNVPLFIRLYWRFEYVHLFNFFYRMKPTLPEPHLAAFLVLDNDSLPNNFRPVNLAKNFTIIHTSDKEKNIVKSIF